jgi:hypothetical protein
MPIRDRVSSWLKDGAADDPYEWAPEEEAEWRGQSGCWAVTDFFQVFKDQYQKLEFILINSIQVTNAYAGLGSDSKGLMEMLQKIYREHGWPDLQRYRKAECLVEIEMALQQQHSNFGISLEYQVNGFKHVWHIDEYQGHGGPKLTDSNLS